MDVSLDIFVIQPSIAGRLDWFLTLAIVKSAAISMMCRYLSGMLT